MPKPINQLQPDIHVDISEFLNGVMVSVSDIMRSSIQLLQQTVEDARNFYMKLGETGIRVETERTEFILNMLQSHQERMKEDEELINVARKEWFARIKALDTPELDIASILKTIQLVVSGINTPEDVQEVRQKLLEIRKHLVTEDPSLASIPFCDLASIESISSTSELDEYILNAKQALHADPELGQKILGNLRPQQQMLLLSLFKGADTRSATNG